MINSQLGMERSVLNYVLCNFDACVAKVCWLFYGVLVVFKLLDFVLKILNFTARTNDR